MEGNQKEDASSGKKGCIGGREEGEELWTKTRTTRMLFMEEISEASSTVPSASFTEIDDAKDDVKMENSSEKTSLTSDAEVPRSPTIVESGVFSPKISPSLRRRSPGSSGSAANIPVRPEVISPAHPTVAATRESTENNDVGGGDDGDKDVEAAEDGVKLSIEKLNVGFQKKASVMRDTFITAQPLRPFDNLAKSGDHKMKAPFKRTASHVGKVMAGFHGRAKSMHQTDELVSFTDTLLYDILKPLFIAMKFTGLFFVRPKGTALFQNAHRRCFTSVSCAQIYSLLILFILTVNCVRSFWAFSPDDGFGYILFFKLLWTILWYDSASRSLFFNIMWYAKKTGLPALFISLERVCYTDGIVPYEDSLRKTVCQLAVSMVCFGAVAFGSFVYGFFGSEQIRVLFDTILPPVPGDVAYLWVYKAFLLLVVLLNILVSCLSMTFYIVICYILYKEFEYLCRTFGMKISSDGQFVDDLEKFRITHQQRCKLVEQTDQILKYFVASTFTAHVPLLCLLMYNLLDMEQKMAYRLYGLYWMIMVMVQSVTVAVAATMLNTQAHAPLAYIYGIRAQSTTLERQLVVNMFLNKLTGTSIGLTAWDMFIINKPTMLTVIGMILTYFFLLVQFRNPLQDASSTTTACACTLLNHTGQDITNMYTVSNVM